MDSKLSIKEVFESMDSNDDGKINGPELQKGIVDLCDENLTPSQVFDLLKEFDADDDGSLDPMELISAIESLEMGIVSDKSKPSKPTKDKTTKVFPTDLQKAMMGKKWNDVWWPLIHTAIFVLAVVWIANGLIGFVDGSGGPVAYDGDGEYFAGEWLEKGDIYPCDKEIQKSECSNSLTPLAGTNGASSMPKGFYWDGIVLILLSLSFFGGSLYSHLVLMNNWRAKAKKIKADSDGSENESKENIEDSEDHNEEDDSGDDDDEEDSDDDDDEDDSDDDDEEDSDDDDVEEDSDGDDEEDSDGDDEEDSDDDEIDIGSRIGVEIDGKEFFGEIIEFNDEEGIVVIEDEDSGEELTAMQDDMFVE